MGFLSRVFGETPKPQIWSDSDRIATALLAILRPQAEMLGFGLDCVPCVENFGSVKARGALLGTALGIATNEGATDPAVLIDAAKAAFVLIYGEETGSLLHRATVADLKAQSVELHYYSEWAIEDVKGIYRSVGVTSSLAFVLAVRGDI